MAKSFVSPGIFTTEIDASFLGAGVGQIGAALIGTAPKGPAFVPVTVTNFSEFSTYFGDLHEDHDLTYAARAYLRNAGSANIVRVLGPTGRTVNGAAVNPGYTAESLWAVVLTGAAAGDNYAWAVIEVTGSAALQVVDLTGSGGQFFLKLTGSSLTHATSDGFIALTASTNSGSSNYIAKVLNTDPTKFSTQGHFLREIYEPVVFKHGLGLGGIISASLSNYTAFTMGYNSGSTPWIKSQPFAGIEYNLLKMHTLGHGAVENGRFKIIGI